MTRGQEIADDRHRGAGAARWARRQARRRRRGGAAAPLVVIAPTAEELAAHAPTSRRSTARSRGRCIWLALDGGRGGA